MSPAELNDIQTMQCINNIRARLQAIHDAHPWTFNPEYPMFMGTTNAIEMWDRTLDLGRNAQHWIPSTDPNVKGYVLSPASIQKNATTKALGVFLQNCREDIEYLLRLLGDKVQQ